MKNNIWLSQFPDLKEFEKTGKLPLDADKFYYSALVKMSRIKKPDIHFQARVSSSAKITGNVIIESGAQILPYAIIQGPAYIGQNVVIGNYSFIRPNSLISRNSLIGNHSYCNEAFVGPYSRISHFCGFSRSILGKNSTLSAYVLTATLRADYKSFSRKGKRSVPKKGCLIGNNTFIAPHTTIMPNIIIGDDCFIGSFLFIDTNLSSGSRIRQLTETIIDKNPLKVKLRGISKKSY